MSYPHVNSPQRTGTADNDTRQRLHPRARIVQSKVLDGLERMLDTMAQQHQADALTLTDARRQYANMLHAATVCANVRCRRKRSCQGEPAHCLRVLLPTIGLDKAAAHLLPQRPLSKRSRRAAQNDGIQKPAVMLT